MMGMIIREISTADQEPSVDLERHLWPIRIFPLIPHRGDRVCGAQYMKAESEDVDSILHFPLLFQCSQSDHPF